MFKFWNQPSIKDRRFQRVACEQVAELFLPDRRVALNGMLVEVSKGGALFREASRFILDRRRARVVVRAAGLEIAGTIVNVRDVGYGINFDDPIDEDLIARLADSRDAAA